MNHEANRLRTFRNWPTAAEVDKARIAQCGFFYLGHGVEVQCFACGGKISEWNYGDQVMVRHRELDAQCPFILNPASSGNIPEGLSTVTEISQGDRNAEIASRDEIYKNDALRLLSYVHWPVTSPPREEMVLAGFYHLTGEQVRCAWCGVEVHRNWSPRDDPFEEHRRLSPQCPYIIQRDSTPASTSLPAVPITTTTEPFTTPSSLMPMHNRDLSYLNTNVMDAQDVWESLGVVPVAPNTSNMPTTVMRTLQGTLQGPRRPAYASVSSRLETFRNWPNSSPLTPTALAQAGFYFTGTSDQVRCFYCDGGLGMWEPDDDPWSEHKRWFSRCPFLNLVRPDPTSIRNTNGSSSRNPSTDYLLSRRNSGSCETLSSQLTPTFRSLREDAVPPPGWIQVPFRSNKSGSESGLARLSVVNPPAAKKSLSAKRALSGDNNAELECLPNSSEMEMIVKALQDENRQLKEAKLCKVCMDNEVSTVFLPCGHAAGCSDCALGLTDCPLCRAEVHALVRAYLP